MLCARRKENERLRQAVARQPGIAPGSAPQQEAAPAIIMPVLPISLTLASALNPMPPVDRRPEAKPRDGARGGSGAPGGGRGDDDGDDDYGYDDEDGDDQGYGRETERGGKSCVPSPASRPLHACMC